MDENEMVTVTSKGQMVIPARFRWAMAIRKGTRVSVTRRNGQLILQPVTDEFIRSLWGSLKGGPSLRAFLQERRQEGRRENLRAGLKRSHRRAKG